ncbi:MAG: SIMPL domain-containing protein [Anaerolineales bacterium]|nr:SIMPL domain-containing protein [Anaerolineales bacterium]
MKTKKQFQKNLLVLSVVVVLILSGCAGSSNTAADSGGAERTITVSSEGTAYGEPDQVSIQIGVETFGESVVSVSSQNEVVMKGLFEAIMEEGVLREDIQTSNYSVWSESQYNESGYQGIAGYRVTNQVSIIVRQIDNLSQVLQAAMDSGANNIYGVTFGVSDSQPLRSEARHDAVANAEQVAQELASLSGQELGPVISITEVTAYNGMMDYTRAQSGGGGDAPAPSIAPGLVSAYIQLQVTYSVR